MQRRRAATITAITIAAVAPALAIAPMASADPGHHHSSTMARSPQSAVKSLKSWSDKHLTPRTHFIMAPDGSSGKTQDGEGIPNIDIVKKTIRTYYNADTHGIASKTSSPYISQMDSILGKETTKLKALYQQSIKSGKKPAIVFDADDTTLMTYDMEDGAMHFNFDPALQDVWVQDEKFPATPAMPAFVKAAQDAGFTIFGLTGRNDDQKAATVGNLSKVGYGDAFTLDRFYTKWTGKGDSQQPSYITCATAKCTTVEFKAGTRKHIESMGYDIALNVGDQFSDLQGGSADHYLKLPNPTYYLPSPDLPGMNEPELSPRTRFTMAADGSSGETQGGEGIPNIDSVKSTIRTYYNATNGIADPANSPYRSEMTRLTSSVSPLLDAACSTAKSFGMNPAIVLDADDTTLMTYDMEDGAMKFNYDPALQDVWVQGEKFPATPGMVALVNAADRAGCTLIGLTGRNDAQKAATMGNLAKVGYTGFTEPNYYTKWTGVGDSQQPSYIHCATAKCTTIEYKSQTRAHVETASGGDYTILANFGDQFSDLIGGHSLVSVKLPNPTYYLP